MGFDPRHFARASRVAVELANYGIGECRDRVDAAPVAARLTRARQTGEFERDQIVDQTNEFRPCRRLESRDRPGAVEVLMRDR